MSNLTVIIVLSSIVVFIFIVALIHNANITKDLKRRLDEARKQAERALERLTSLSENYEVGHYVCSFERALNNFSSHHLEQAIAFFKARTAEINEILDDPDGRLKRKAYDYLNDTVLTDPVPLQIKHKTKGKLTVVVNRNTKERYLQSGGEVFAKRRDSRSYRVRRGWYDGGFDLDLFDIVDEFFYYSDFYPAIAEVVGLDCPCFWLANAPDYYSETDLVEAGLDQDVYVGEVTPDDVFGDEDDEEENLEAETETLDDPIQAEATAEDFEGDDPYGEGSAEEDPVIADPYAEEATAEAEAEEAAPEESAVAVAEEEPTETDESVVSDDTAY